MKASFVLNGSILTYISNKDIGLSRTESDWGLDIKEIKIIGYSRVMDGDDDSFFIIFIDFSNQLYIVNVTWDELSEQVESLLHKEFNISFDWEKVIDESYVLFPLDLFHQPLYKKWYRDYQSFLFEFKRFFCYKSHVASGVLTDEILSFPFTPKEEH